CCQYHQTNHCYLNPSGISTEKWNWSQRQLTLQTGASVNIPCHYDMKYKQYKKYWCCERATAFSYCTIMAYANNTNKKVTVTDNPAQSLFTVTMRDLQERNTGAYWCAVEISGLFQPDVKAQRYITVKSAPAVSVTKSRVSGEEGSSVSVQCLYSAAYKKEAKKWCRSIDWTCYTVGRTNTSQNSAVQISDDGKDAGWYWCSAGGLEVPVHFDVTDALAGIITCIVSFKRWQQ
uniref:Ig-like domain-containing protein n=1 Tax=Electrophorus electricus TaxID=8005 RepID=A0A4W4GX84_ELEEL